MRCRETAARRGGSTGKNGSGWGAARGTPERRNALPTPPHPPERGKAGRGGPLHGVPAVAGPRARRGGALGGAACPRSAVFSLKQQNQVPNSKGLGFSSAASVLRRPRGLHCQLLLAVVGPAAASRLRVALFSSGGAPAWLLFASVGAVPGQGREAKRRGSDVQGDLIRRFGRGDVWRGAGRNQPPSPPVRA